MDMTMETQENGTPELRLDMIDRLADLLRGGETKPKSKITDCHFVDGDFSRFEIRKLSFKVVDGTLFLSPREPRADDLTIAEIKKNPGMAQGQITRQAGQIKRLKEKLAKAERLAATRLHGGK